MINWWMPHQVASRCTKQVPYLIVVPRNHKDGAHDDQTEWEIIC